MMNWGLLVCAHGSRARSWNLRVSELAASVAERPEIEALFGERVGVAFLEAAPPSLAAGVRQLRSLGADRIAAVPLFLTASSHLHDDLPVALGLRRDVAVERQLREEGIEVLACPSEVVLTAPLASGDALGRNAARRLARLGDSPPETGVLFTYYGSRAYEREWDDLARKVGEHLEATRGYAGYCGAPVGHWVEDGPAAVARALRSALHQWRRVAVLPLLISQSQYQTEYIPTAIRALSAEEQARVSYSGCAILPCPDIHQWVADTAIAAAHG